MSPSSPRAPSPPPSRPPQQPPAGDRVADAPPSNWVDRYAPSWARPYLRLMRADRPIGIWLLLWPCWWAQLLAEKAVGAPTLNLWFLTLFAIGATVMRGAGCTYNDIIDRDFDAQVARTRSRPLPSGQVSTRAAAVFMVLLALIGLLVLLQFNSFTQLLGISSLAVVALYPFMKRLTSWPQVVLGAAFGWGALLGWSAITGTLAPAAIALYLATLAWTVGYDTIYAHQDKEDDALLGLKSTALRFGARTKAWLTGFYGAALILLALAGYLAAAGVPYALGLAVAGGHFAWQITTLRTDDPENCLVRFKSNRDLGAILFLALLADRFL